VKRYKQVFEERSPTNKLNPFTMIRHCLYLADRTMFSKALSKLARESLDEWLAANAGGLS
jgi:putative GTP pyrophosphokinase